METKTEIICPNLPPPQDTPPPLGWGSSPSQNHQQTYVTCSSNSITLQIAGVKQTDTSWRLSNSLQQLLSSNELEVTTHDVFSEDGKERVCASCFSMHYH